MNRLRQALVAAGVAVVVLGVAMTVNPGLAASVSAPRDLVVIVGVLAVFQGVRMVQARRHAVRRAAETDDPEVPARSPVPGEAFDDDLADLGRLRRSTTSRRRQVRQRLRKTVISVIVQRENCSRAEAERRVDAGEWTADPDAAAFVGEDVDAPPLSVAVRRLLARQTRFERGATGTVAELGRLAGVNEEP